MGTLKCITINGIYFESLKLNVSLMVMLLFWVTKLELMSSMLNGHILILIENE